ncbi:MaoC/PaaZ C-terminal domain-containing protein [Piscibacillus halophilus]|uniref:MaoC/PaaZ C-terminal domain-containing protein n=1 Tax=Piscibacillus halophilus TaxID=571933 RepID=UPI002409973D|nr:MaoC/PaaZ C-terminal domain-containing protein [Piscibacillus halophilus]
MSNLKSLSINDVVEPIELEPVNRLDLIKYAGASDDYNPIHTIDREAEKAGLSGIIAHGMWTMGNLSRLFSQHIEEGYIEDYRVRFTGMVFLDDVLTLQGKLVDREDSLLIFDVNVAKQDGQKVIQGQVSFRLWE